MYRLSDKDIHTLNNALLGDHDAVSLCADLWLVSHVWDDLIDKDRDIAQEDINAAFQVALISIPNNIFYQAHSSVLSGAIEALFTSWLASTKLEERDWESRAVAHGLRMSVTSIVLVCARIIGGFSHSQNIAAALYEAAYDGEPFDHYMKEAS